MASPIASNPHELIHVNFLLHMKKGSLFLFPLNLGQFYDLFFSPQQIECNKSEC